MIRRSLDARSKGQSGHAPIINDVGVNGNTSSAAGLLFSRNARPQKALVGRAQWETEQATLGREETSKLGKANSE
jgi:hypothetical protein